MGDSTSNTRARISHHIKELLRLAEGPGGVVLVEFN
jgi:hypothetical protein